MSAVKFDSSIDMVIEMENWQDGKLYDRLGADEHFTTLLDVRIPSLTIPVRPGRNPSRYFLFLNSGLLWIKAPPQQKNAVSMRKTDTSSLRVLPQVCGALGW